MFESSSVVVEQTNDASPIAQGLVGYGPLGLAISDQLTFEEWQAAGETLKRMEGAIQWWVGDWLVYGERKWGEMYSQALDATSKAYQTLANYKYVAEKFEFSRRRENLTWGHHEAVAGIDNPDHLLDLAEQEDWSIRELRAEVSKATRQAKHLAIAASADKQPVPLGPFPLIYADPPWKWGHFGEKDKENEAGKGRTPDQHYPTLTYDEIKQFKIGDKPIAEIANKNAALFLWCTSANLALALEVMEAWGFEYKTHFVWVKDKTGLGLICRNQHEILLYGTRGAMPGPQVQFSSVFSYPRGEHSAKPPEIRTAIEQMYPDFKQQHRLELFARGRIDGWSTYGFEARQEAA
jgi:N6-adenosine-specific RNA methylase IME4